MKIFNPPPPPNSCLYRQLRFGLIALSATIIISSCTDDQLNESKGLAYNPKFETYYKLVTFYEKMEGLPQTYSVITPRTDYSDTDVRDYVEGTMNLVYTDPNLTWASYEQTIDTFTLSLSGGYATEQAVEALYDQVVDSASVFFYRISEPDKFPYLYDVEIIGSSSSYVQITVEHVTGKVHRDPTPFGSTDYWSVFEGEGHCGPESGGTENASDRQNIALTDYFTPYGCVVWSNLSNISVEDLEEFGWGETNPNDPNPGDFIIDYRTFYVECDDGGECDDLADNGVFCLDPNEMNYYFQSIKSIYEDYTDDSGLHLRMSTFGLLRDEVGSPNYYYWTGFNRFGTRTDCDEGGSFPYALPQCC